VSQAISKLDVKERKEPKTKRMKVGVVGVDSGQVIIIDPCYLHPPVENRAGGWEEEKHYKECMEVGTPTGREFTINGETCEELIGAGSVYNGLAVASHTGGDGLYPVYATIRNGNVVKLEIVFGEESYLTEGIRFKFKGVERHAGEQL
jgi:hypothetical protein